MRRKAALRSLLSWIARALDALLPGPPESEAWTGERSEQESRRRRLRLRLHMLSKRGKGGYR